MAEVLTMTDRTSPHPQNMPALVGHGITTVVGGLTPAMLGLLLLVLVGVGAAVYFLRILILGQQEFLHLLLTTQQQETERILSVTQAQMTAVLRTHDREFDVLMGMIKQSNPPPLPEEPPREFLPPPRPP